jgi:hypothetical protein
MDGFVKEYGAAYDQILWRNMVLSTIKFCEAVRLESYSNTSTFFVYTSII